MLVGAKVSMTAESKPYLIYAKGGGLGHLRRAFVIQDGLKSQGYDSLIWCSSRALSHQTLEGKGKHNFSDFLSEKNPSAYKGLITDTFPFGVQNELDESWILKFEERLLIERYIKKKKPARDGLYSRVLRPYNRLNDEWAKNKSEAKDYAGLLVGHFPFEIVFKKDVLAVVDFGCRLNLNFKKIVEKICDQTEFKSHFLCEPQNIYGEKILVIGAGYNTFYELLLDYPNHDIMFLPLRRRFDDQERRACLQKRAILSPRDLLVWMKSKKKHESFLGQRG